MKKQAILPITIALVVIIIVAAIILIAVRRTAAPSAVPTSDTTPTSDSSTPSDTPSDASSGSKTPASGLTLTSDEPQLVGLGTTAVKNGNDALFTIKFQITASDHDIYLSQTCHQKASSDGITFAFLKNGTDDSHEVGSQGCLLVSSSGAESLPSHRFKVARYSTAAFQLIIAATPASNGTYQAGVSQIGYALSDAKGTTLFPSGSHAMAGLQSNTVSW